ncbi:hypothetical protein L9G74_19100 [Shewanella sp. C32]|uniref:Uncharacterized protein n=1 Tax=Shewanella electrica TaxID=515560 RepID=A0ABT2FQN3_9GAMM|nr:hypothetical protein [Shewanella electrica]MCH1926863.1 hypothetical protein [Shewanella electrica]MCS4558548.1 hypothetical protein [Shewanella electrica]
MEHTLDKTEIYNALLQQAFVQHYIKRFEDVYAFNEDSFRVEHTDAFGQLTVWLGFEDQFAIRDASGQWREATAEECMALMQGLLPGAHTLIN